MNFDGTGLEKTTESGQNGGFWGGMFESGADALLWSAEVLRRRRFPKLSRIWSMVVDEGEGGEPRSFNPFLPADPELKYALAVKIDGLVNGLGETGQLLRLFAWGDWADEGRLQAAVAIQERMRRQGVRVRLSYRYSYRRLGEMLGHDHKWAIRQVNEGLRGLEAAMRGTVYSE